MTTPRTAGPASWSAPPSLAHRVSAGRDMRARTPRSSLATLTVDSRDPLGILDAQNAARLRDLVPVRRERMAEGPFPFYRGAAAIMAADLARDPHTGLLVASCGDAHLGNFGFYASPQRSLVFDLNDFDEAAWAPWEWDLKRLVASVVVAGQATARDERTVEDAALAAVRTYARALRTAARHTPLHRYFSHFDIDQTLTTLDDESQEVLRAAAKDSRRRTGARAARKLTTTTDDGRVVFVEHPPTTTTVARGVRDRLHEFVDEYLATAQVDIRALLAQYTVSDVARRVVGVGSVGTRCGLIAFQDGDGDALILQAKEAVVSVLEEYGGIRQPDVVRDHVTRYGEGGRVVALQRVLQAVSDPFLGHARVGATHFYVRQFHDMKGGIDASTLEDVPFQRYAQACAAALARAHSQSPNAGAIAGYVGGGRALGTAILGWSLAYAEVSRADYELFVSG